jgi:multiple sugar transport system substrate-binding protein
MSGSALGREAEILHRQLDRFRRAHPELLVELRPTPDSADQRRQLYVQWLNARAVDPDVLQLDVVWTAEFAAAGWIAPLDEHRPDIASYPAAAIRANTWNGSLYALPWFVDVGMLYWRTDLVPRAPGDFAELQQLAAAARARGAPYGFIWQGARYEGLVTVFLEHLTAFGGAILNDSGEVTVDAEPAVAALTAMRDEITGSGITPPAVLAWQEEQVRLAFQNGQAAFMRNWPYAYSLVDDDAESTVAGRVRATAFPAASGGQPAAALGGAQLAINAHSDQQDDAYRLIAFLLQPEQMIERARIAGQFPSRLDLYEGDTLTAALKIPPADAAAVIRSAVARPVTPVYGELSGILQVSLHRALTGQQAPRAALQDAAAAMRRLLAKVKLGPAA